VFGPLAIMPMCVKSVTTLWGMLRYSDWLIAWLPTPDSTSV
jgi:hypothetical protein